MKQAIDDMLRQIRRALGPDAFVVFLYNPVNYEELADAVDWFPDNPPPHVEVRPEQYSPVNEVYFLDGRYVPAKFGPNGMEEIRLNVEFDRPTPKYRPGLVEFVKEES